MNFERKFFFSLSLFHPQTGSGQNVSGSATLVPYPYLLKRPFCVSNTQLWQLDPSDDDHHPQVDGSAKKPVAAPPSRPTVIKVEGSVAPKVVTLDYSPPPPSDKVM